MRAPRRLSRRRPSTLRVEGPPLPREWQGHGGPPARGEPNEGRAAWRRERAAAADSARRRYPMSRALKYVLTSSAIVALLVIGILAYLVVKGPSPSTAAATTPSPAASVAPGTAFSPAAIYQKSSSGVVLVQSTFGRRQRRVRRQGAGQRVHRRHQRHDPDQRPRRHRERHAGLVGHGRVPARDGPDQQGDQGQGPRRRPDQRRGGAQDRPVEPPADAAPAGRLQQPRHRPVGRGHRQSARLRLLADPRHRLRARPGSRRRRTAP